MHKCRAATSAALQGLASVGLAGMLSSCSGQSLPTGPENRELRNLTQHQVAVQVGSKSFIMTLYDNPTAHDLLAKLPMSLKASDYPGYDEKVLRLPYSLSMKGAPPGDSPLIPEIGYYEPGRWIALYYGPIGYWSGKVPLGKIDAGIADLRTIPDGSSVKIELLK